MSSYYDQYWTKGKNTWSPSMGSLLPVEEQLISPHLGKDTALLDYGCGNGERYGATLTARGVNYNGFDISPEAVAQANAAGLKASLLVDGFRTTLADGSCDLALCFEVLEHLLEPDQAVREIARVLKDSSAAIFSVPNAGAWFPRLEFLLTGFWNPGGSPLTARKAPWRDPHIRFFNPRLLRRILLENGFSEVRITGMDFNLQNLPYVYRAKRLGNFARLASYPVRGLGHAVPSLFSGRIFATARK